MSFNPVYSFLNTICLFIRRRICFLKGKIGKTLIMPDGQEYTVFREVKIAKKSAEKDFESEPVVFRVRFLLQGMKTEDNIRFSKIPIPFFVGLPGFQAKLWTLNYKNNYFQGIYQWKSREYAEKYSKSFAYHFMASRSVEGSVSYEIISGTTLEDYYDLLNSK